MFLALLAGCDGTSASRPRTLYPEGARHSPITVDLAERIQQAAASHPRHDHVFAKVGDSITVASESLTCFDGGLVDLGSRADLRPTLEQFRASDAAGSSPFGRSSLAANGGTTATDVMAGSPCPLQREIDAIDPRLAVVMFGTNEVRFGQSVDQFGAGLWTAIDEVLLNGAIPIMSTIPPIDQESDARIPTFNHVIRAIAQGRAVPLVDLHRELMPLPNRGLAADGIHLSVAVSGACDLTAAGLAAGYNVRNLLTLEALVRTDAALAGAAPDANAPARSGSGTADDPWTSTLPLVDLADTRDGTPPIATSGCGGRELTDHAVTYRIDLAVETSLTAYVVDRPGVDVDVHVLAGTPSACVASSDQRATATVGPGAVSIVIDSPGADLEGEYVLVVE